MIQRKILRIGYLSAFIFVMYACSDNTVTPEDPCLYGPQLQIDQIQASVIGKSTGIITVSASEGKNPYAYSIDGINFQTDGAFDKLSAGEITVSVKDANNCIESLTLAVPEVPEVFYANQIRPIIDSDCQKSGCHGSNSTIPSWATYNDVKASADLIKLKTSNKTMPPTGALTPTKIQLISDWVDQGAPNN